MAVQSSLLAKIPIPQQPQQIKTPTPVVASVKVSDVPDDTPRLDNEPMFKIPFLNNLFEKFKASYIRKRIEKLESIPQEQRTASQQAELDANQQSLDYML